jgi:hypothetical protein
VHRLIPNDPFQQRRGGIPGDPSQFEETGVEPGGEGVLQFLVESFQARALVGHREKIGPHRDQPLRALRREVEHADQLLARRTARLAERLGRSLVTLVLPAGNGRIDRGAVTRVQVVDLREKRPARRHVARLVELEERRSERRTRSPPAQRQQCPGKIEQSFAAGWTRRDADPRQKLAEP